jgi:hypothetical protein
MVLGSIRNRKIIASILAAVGIHAAGSHSSVRVAVGYRLPDHRTVRDCQGGSSQWSRVTGERLGVKFPGPTRRSSTTTSRLLSIDANGEPGLSELQLSLGKTFPRVWRCRLWFLRRYWLYRAAVMVPLRRPSRRYRKLKANVFGEVLGTGSRRVPRGLRGRHVAKEHR